MSEELVLAFAESVRSIEAPPETPELRGRILAEYDRTFVASSRRRPFVAAAAAALVLAAIGLLLRTSKPPAGPEAEMLEVRALALASMLAEPETAAPRRPIVLRPKSVDQYAALAAETPATVYRLVAARLFEPVDREEALARYLELLRDFPDGSSAAVAAARLKTLRQP